MFIVDCPIGYHYWNCSRKCQHPFYGKDCQKECNCNMDDCHFSYGCPSIKCEHLFRKPIILAHVNASKFIGMQFSCIVVFLSMINIEQIFVKHSLLLLNLSILEKIITMIFGILPFLQVIFGILPFLQASNTMSIKPLHTFHNMVICTCKIVTNPTNPMMFHFTFVIKEVAEYE